jgi:hypothetical protein
MLDGKESEGSMVSRSKICESCGVDQRFRKLHKKQEAKLQSDLALAKEAAQRWRRMYENKCKVADSLGLQLSRLQEP